MALPASGAISFSDINVEMGVSATNTRTLDESTTRTLFGVASGQISMSQGYGKAKTFAFAIASNQTNADLRTLAVAAGWNESDRVQATINSGVYVSSDSTTRGPALAVSGTFPNGVELINNGFIVGMGGAGGAGRDAHSAAPNSRNGSVGAGGGLALSVSVATTISNSGTIAGGGGGGGGGGAGVDLTAEFVYGHSGGGGGGGRSSAAANSSGAASGVLSGLLGYRSASGAAGTVTALGAGGAGYVAAGYRGGNGGNGGAWGAAGSTGGSASGFPSVNGTGLAGGSAGAAVSGNSNITWVATGTRLGAIA